jgi:hypothetical protein
MNTDRYRLLIDQKLSDAWHNYELTEKAYREAKAIYESILVQKESYEKLVMEGMADA